MRTLILAMILASALTATSLRGQTLTVTSAQPALAGSLVTAVLNNGSGQVLTWIGNPLHLLTGTGELAQGVPFGSDLAFALSPGGTFNFSFMLPSTGPGSDGSFLLRFSGGLGGSAIARLDVGTPDPLFPPLHAYPARYPSRFQGHGVDFAGPQADEWELANSSAFGFSYSVGDRIDIVVPGGSSPLASFDLSGMSIAARSTLRIPLPLTGLAPVTYTVRSFFSGSSTTHGIQNDPRIDLNLPAGRNMPIGGALPVQLHLSDFTAGLPQYALIVSFQPGFFIAPDGTAVPVDPSDPLVPVSVLTGLGGLIVNGVGTALPFIAPPLPFYTGNSVADGVSMNHPGPMFSGFTIRFCGIGFDPMTGAFGASQPEEVILQ